MTFATKQDEIDRLIAAFETEASKFYDIQMHTFYNTPTDCTLPRKFSHPNHTILLWQYYGALADDADRQRFVDNAVASGDMKRGIVGAELTMEAVVEGDEAPLFARMAERAGTLFDGDDSELIRSKSVDDIQKRESEKNPGASATVVLNDHPIARWINYLLHFISMTHPGREKCPRIQPDPFTLSLLALEELKSGLTITRSDKSVKQIQNLEFRVALSFPGEKRRYVSKVADHLREALAADQMFYDMDYQAQLARPNLDTLLQAIYRNQSELIVVFLCAEYGEKEWCGLEWRAIRDIIKAKEDERIMLVRFDNADIQGVFSVDGYIDATQIPPEALGSMILERLGLDT